MAWGGAAPAPVRQSGLRPMLPTTARANERSGGKLDGKLPVRQNGKPRAQSLGARCLDLLCRKNGRFRYCQDAPSLWIALFGVRDMSGERDCLAVFIDEPAN